MAKFKIADSPVLLTTRGKGEYKITNLGKSVAAEIGAYSRIEVLDRFGKGLGWGGAVIAGIGELQQTNSPGKALAVSAGDVGVNLASQAAASGVAGIISGAEDGALVGEAVGPGG